MSDGEENKGHAEDDDVDYEGDSCDEEGEDEQDEQDEAAENEAKYPGWRRAGRLASRRWKKNHGIDPKTTTMKDLSDEQRQSIKKAKAKARRNFVAKQEENA